MFRHYILLLWRQKYQKILVQPNYLTNQSGGNIKKIYKTSPDDIKVVKSCGFISFRIVDSVKKMLIFTHLFGIAIFMTKVMDYESVIAGIYEELKSLWGEGKWRIISRHFPK